MLGGEAELRDVIELSSLDPETVATVLDLLVRAEVTAGGDPVTFVHPIVRTSIYADIATGETAPIFRQPLAKAIVGSDPARERKQLFRGAIVDALLLRSARRAGHPASVRVTRSRATRVRDRVRSPRRAVPLTRRSAVAEL